MVTAGLIAGVLSACSPEQNKGEEVNTSSHEVSVVVEKQSKQSVEQDEQNVEGIPGLRRRKHRFGDLEYTNGLFTREQYGNVQEFIAAAKDNAENGEKMMEMVHKGDTLGIFTQALTKPHAKQALFQAVKRIILDGNMHRVADMVGAKRLYEQSVTGSTGKFGNIEARKVIFSHLYGILMMEPYDPSIVRENPTFKDFYNEFKLPDILRIISELSPEEKTFLKEAYIQYKNFYFANKTKIDALVQEQERLLHKDEDFSAKMLALWDAIMFSQRLEALQDAIHDEKNKDAPNQDLIKQYEYEKNKVWEEAESAAMQKFNPPYYIGSD